MTSRILWLLHQNESKHSSDDGVCVMVIKKLFSSPINEPWFLLLKITLSVILLQPWKVAMKYALIGCKISSQAVSLRSQRTERSCSPGMRVGLTVDVLNKPRRIYHSQVKCEDDRCPHSTFTNPRAELISCSIFLHFPRPHHSQRAAY